MKRAPNTTLAKVVAKVIQTHRIDVRNGLLYGQDGNPVGSNTYEPRISVRVAGKKYNARVHKIMGYVLFGVDALKKGNKVVHLNGNRFNNRDTNLGLIRKAKAPRKQVAA